MKRIFNLLVVDESSSMAIIVFHYTLVSITESFENLIVG